MSRDKTRWETMGETGDLKVIQLLCTPLKCHLIAYLSIFVLK